MLYNKFYRRESAKISARKVQTEVQTHRLKEQKKRLEKLSQANAIACVKSGIHAGFEIKTIVIPDKLKQTSV